MGFTRKWRHTRACCSHPLGSVSCGGGVRAAAVQRFDRLSWNAGATLCCQDTLAERSKAVAQGAIP